MMQRQPRTRMLMLWIIALALVLGGAPWVVYLAQAAHNDADSYDYRIPVVITNGATFTLDYPVCAYLNPAGLIAGGFLEADALDAALFDVAETDLHGFTRTDTSSADNCWWIEPPQDLLAGQIDSSYLHLGSSGADVTNRFHFETIDEATVNDDASLDITSNLTVDVGSLTLDTLATVNIVEKAEAYALGTTAAGEGRFTFWGSSTNEDEAPGANVGSVAYQRSGCTSVTHYDCIDDAIGAPDDDTSYLWSNVGTARRESYDLTNDPLGADDVWVSVTIHSRARETVASTGSWTAGFVTTDLGTTYDGPSNAADVAYITATDAFTPSDVGSSDSAWSNDLWNARHLTMVLTDNAGDMRLTQAVVRIAYLPYHNISGGTVTLDVPIDLRGTFDGTTQALLIDGATVATDTPSSSTINASSEDLVIGGGVEGSLTTVRVGDTSIASPTWKLDLQNTPAQISQTVEGNSANGWRWQGVLTDQSASTNDAAYILIRDMASITVDVQALESKAALPFALVSTDLATVLDLSGSTLSPDFKVATTGSDFGTFTGDDTLVTLVENPGLNPDGLWLMIVLLPATIIGGGLTRASRGNVALEGVGLFVIGACLFVGLPLGWYGPGVLTLAELLLVGSYTMVKTLGGRA